MKRYSIEKVATTKQISELYEYFKPKLKEVEMYSISKFIERALMGRLYIARNSLKEIIGGIFANETPTHIYLAYWYIDEKHRRYKNRCITKEFYGLIRQYSRDKNKRVLAKLNDYSYNLGRVIKPSEIDGIVEIDVTVGDNRVLQQIFIT